MLGGSGERAVGKHRRFVAVLAGEVAGEPPLIGRTRVPQPAQGQDLALGKYGIYVGERGTEPHPHLLELGPLLLLVGAEPLSERSSDRLLDLHVGSDYAA